MKERHLGFVEAVQIINRMTKYDGNNCGCTIECLDCPLCIGKNGRNIICGDLMNLYPEEYEKILIKWDEEHPSKTRAMDFFEKHPNASNRDGIPEICAKFCGYCEGCGKHYSECDCEGCWNTPLEEE